MKLGMHEAAELHELLVFKAGCTAKSSMMAGMVDEEPFKRLLQRDVQSSKRHIQQLQGFLSGVKQ